MKASELFASYLENEGVEYIELKTSDAISRHAYKKAGTR